MRSSIHLDAEQRATAWAAVSEIRTNVLVIDQNAHFVLKELTNLSHPGEHEIAIREVWESLSSCCYDVQKEVRNLEDKLGLHGDAEWFDPGLSNDNPRVTTGFITSWLSRELRKIDLLVRSLEQSTQKSASSAYILVAESAVNCLHAMMTIHNAIDVIHALQL